MKALKFIPFVLFILFYNCNKIKKEKQSIPIETKQETEINTKPEKEKQIKINTEPENKKQLETNNEAIPELFFLNELLGKYPTQINLFDNTVLTGRLKKIEKLDFERLIAYWNVETPLTRENQIIHASGCKQHDCPSNGYELFIDLKNDNINIYHFSGNTLRVYKEKGWIELPKVYQNEIDIKMENAKIGSTSDDMESTYNITTKK